VDFQKVLTSRVRVGFMAGKRYACVLEHGRRAVVEGELYANPA